MLQAIDKIWDNVPKLDTYQFLVEGAMPCIDYFTFTDRFLILSFAILFSTIAESLVVFWLIKIDKEFISRIVDMFFRIAFPIVYVALIILLYLIDVYYCIFHELAL